MAGREFPPALPHGELQELFPDVYFVMGSVRMPAPIPVIFSRNMVVLRHGEALTLVHSMRLDEAGLKRLEALGNVEHVIRLAGFHGMDDPFYKDRYGAKVWAVDGLVYATGFDNTKTKAEDGYFQPDAFVKAGDDLPIPDASLITIDCRAGEGLLLLERDGGILISGDALQNWRATKPFFSLPAKVMMRMMGFIKPHNVGPGWLKQSEPNLADVKRIMDLEFEHVLPVHGEPVIGDAKNKYRPAVERATA